MDNMVKYSIHDYSDEDNSLKCQDDETQGIPQEAVDAYQNYSNEDKFLSCQDYKTQGFSQEAVDASLATKVESISNLVSQNVEVVNRVLDVATQITDVYRESQQLAAKVEVVKEYGKIELAKTAAKFQTTKALIEETFGERREALSAYYKVLDTAIENGNEDMILKAMQMIGSVVVTSPLSQIQEFVKAFETKGAPLLDF